MLTLITDMQDFQSHTKYYVNFSESGKDSEESHNNVSLQLSGNVGLFLKISENHNMKISFGIFDVLLSGFF